MKLKHFLKIFQKHYRNFFFSSFFLVLKNFHFIYFIIFFFFSDAGNDLEGSLSDVIKDKSNGPKKGKANADLKKAAALVDSAAGLVPKLAPTKALKDVKRKLQPNKNEDNYPGTMKFAKHPHHEKPGPAPEVSFFFSSI